MLFYLIFPFIFITARKPLNITLWAVGSVMVSQVSRVFMIEEFELAWPFPYTSIVNQFPVFIVGVAIFHTYVALREMQYKSGIGEVLLVFSVIGMCLLAYLFRVEQIESSFICELHCVAYSS